MKYREDDYEDELDRMRARQQKRKSIRGGGTSTDSDSGMPAARRQSRDRSTDDFEENAFEIEDLDEESYDKDSYDDDFYDDDPEYEKYEGFTKTEYEEDRGNTSMTQNRNRRLQHPDAAPAAPTRRQAARARKRRKKKLIFRILLLAAVLIASLLFFRRQHDDGYWTVAVFGVDSRDGNTGKGALSDVEILASINRKTGEIRLLSVFRDSYLKINSEGRYDKINEAYFLGGHQQATDALSENLNIQIDDYATFNWKAVVDAINVLGGIDLEITDREFAYINSFITETVNSTGVGSVQLTQSGMNHLDGVQAVAYARLRLMDTDFNRTERQRKVIGLAMEKAKAADFNTLRTLVGAVYPQISTSIGVDDILGIARNASKYYIGQTSGFPFSHSEMSIDKKSCVIPTTLESNVVQLHSYLYDDTEYQAPDTVRQISRHIAEKTGLSEPGNDTESGKNAGAQGNTGSGQSSSSSGNSGAQSSDNTGSSSGSSSTTESPAQTTAGTEETSEEPESEPTSEEPETEESAEESTEEPTGEPAEESTKQESGSETNPYANSASPGVSNGPAGSAQSVPGNTGSGNGSAGPGPGVSERPTVPETSAALEGPGQSSGQNTQEAGPGIQ